jgi:hypothetical protein
VRRIRAISVIPALVSLAAVLAAAAGASSVNEPGTYPIGDLPMLAQQFAPGVAVPTKFPAAIGQFRLAPGRIAGYSQHAKVEVQFEQNSSSLLGFKLDVFSGSRATAIATAVRTYLRRGGWSVTTSRFTAGPYHGVVESQKNGGIRFGMYAWTFAGSTYVITTYLLYGGKSQNAWSKTGVIASFRVP